MVDRTPADRPQAARSRRYKTAYQIARDAAPPNKENYRAEHEFTAGWIALRFLHEPALRRSISPASRGSVNPIALARAGYWRAAPPRRWAGSRRPARHFEQAAALQHRLLRPVGAGQARHAGARDHGAPVSAAERRAGSPTARSPARPSFSMPSTNAISRSRSSPTSATTAGPRRRWRRSANWPPARRRRGAAGRQGRARARAAVRLLRLPDLRDAAFDRSGPRSSPPGLRDRAPGKRLQPADVSRAHASA